MFLMTLFYVCTLRTRSSDMETLPRIALSKHIGVFCALLRLLCTFLCLVCICVPCGHDRWTWRPCPGLRAAKKQCLTPLLPRTGACWNWAPRLFHVYIYTYVYIHVDRDIYAWVEVDWSMLKLSSEAVLCMLMCKLIERKPPPGGGFLFTMFPDQEPCVRDFTTRCDGRILSWNLLHTALDQGTYGVATISRLFKLIGLFCRISSLL